MNVAPLSLSLLAGVGAPRTLVVAQRVKRSCLRDGIVVVIDCDVM